MLDVNSGATILVEVDSLAAIAFDSLSTERRETNLVDRIAYGGVQRLLVDCLEVLSISGAKCGVGDVCTHNLADSCSSTFLGTDCVQEKHVDPIRLFVCVGVGRDFRRHNIGGGGFLGCDRLRFLEHRTAGDQLGRQDRIEIVGIFGEQSFRAIAGAFVVLSFEYSLNLFFEDKRVIVRISVIFILVKLECRDLGRDSGASVAADAESRSVHDGGAFR